MTTQALETDVCIIGGGISAALAAEKLTDEHDVRVLILEAGQPSTPLDQRYDKRLRYVDYGENPWVQDHIRDQRAEGIMSRSMVLGGQALHWGGTTPRFSPEDFRLRSEFGVGHDWPLSYEDLDPFYQEAEERIGVAGDQGPAELDPRGAPYPMPAMPLSWTLERLREWAESADVPVWANPVAKTTVPYDGRNVCQRCDTCNICPTGAKYTPDFTFSRLQRSGRAEIHTGMLVRRLSVQEGSGRIEAAHAVAYERPDQEIEVRASTFVLAAGYVWSPHLLMLSHSSRFPDGLANSSGLVGAYMCGHRNVSAFIELPRRLYPGMTASHSLLSKAFQRPGTRRPYARHDFRIWESTVGKQPRLRDSEGALLLGDACLDDWRSRTQTGTARVRSYYDVIPDRSSRIELESHRTNRFGDPLPRVVFRDAPESLDARESTEEGIRQLFQRLARAGDGRILRSAVDSNQDHPGGGCRMGSDPAESVVDSWGRTWDHENLFVVGAPTLVSAGCNNGTLTFAALTLRAAEEVGRSYPVRS